MSFSVGVRKFAGLTTAVVVGAVTLAACGGSPQEAEQRAPAGEASATQETAQATTRAEGSTAGTGGTTMAMSGSPMAGMETTEVPAIKGLYHGEEILFVHTEVSDQEIANQMTANMGSPLLFVPALERVPEAARADVFVFTNGVSGSSGQGFQPDVFDSAPGDPDYSPLRELNLVTWEDEGSARVLESAADIKEAAQNGEITIEQPGVVFNMPFLTWPGGRR